MNKALIAFFLFCLTVSIVGFGIILAHIAGAPWAIALGKLWGWL